MPETKHAEAIEKQAGIRQSKDVEVWIDKMVQKVKDAKSSRVNWEEKIERNYKKRYGVRPAKKNFPWPGASNTHIFLADEKIRKLKPNFINIAFEGDPLVSFEPIGNTSLSAAQNAELFMDWKLKYHMAQARGFNYFQSMVLIVDDMLGDSGYGIAKILWHHETVHRTRVVTLDDLPDDLLSILQNPLTLDEDLAAILSESLELDPEDPFDRKQIENAIRQFRDGKQTIKIKERYVAYKGSKVDAVDPLDLIIPSSATHIQTAPWLCHRVRMTLNDLKIRQRDGKYRNVDKVEEFRPNQQSNTDIHSTVEIIKEEREGISRFSEESDLVEIWEIYCYRDIDGDGVGEKVVLTIEPESKAVLRLIEFPYDHGKWPFVKFPYELNDPRWYSSRCVTELLDPYQTIVTNQENAKLDRMTLANSFQFIYRVNSVNPANMRYIPGQGIPAKRPQEDIKELQIANLDISFDTEMTKIRGLAENLVGQPDVDLSGTSQERRTAREVGETVAMGRQIFSLDARMFKNSLQELCDQVFELEMQYGDEEVWIRVTVGEKELGEVQTGQADPAETGMKRLRKADMRGNFVLVPNGEFTLLSRIMEQEKAFKILELSMQDQDGVTNKREAWINALLCLAPKAAKRIVNSDAEYAAFQKAKSEAQQAETFQKLAVAGRIPVGGGS